jgi:polyferredoxin
MNEAWFRRFGGFGFIATGWQGWLATALTAATALPLMLVFVRLSDANPVLGWICGVSAFAIVGGFHALAFWKMERDYGG